MAKLSKDGHTVETVYAPEIAALRSQGYRDVEAPKAAAPAEKGPEIDAKPAPKSTK